MRQAGLGWDVTDYGLGQYEKTGLALITLRNGLPGGKPYAEKIMLSQPLQVSAAFSLEKDRGHHQPRRR